MLAATGKLLKIVEDDYVNKSSGELVPQSILVVMGEEDIETTKIGLSSKQIGNGALVSWEKLKGKEVTVPCEIFSFKTGGFKINALGDGLPSNIDVTKF